MSTIDSEIAGAEGPAPEPGAPDDDEPAALGSSPGNASPDPPGARSMEDPPQGTGLSRDGPRIGLTPAALAAIRELLRESTAGEEGGLRLTARTGAGCSAPLQFGMFIEAAPRREDEVLSAHGVRLFLDPEAAWILDGLQVDYVDSPELGEGFAFRHPRGAAGRSC